MFAMLTSVHNRDNGDTEGFGYISDADGGKDPAFPYTDATLPGIAGQSYQTVGFKLLSGVLNQPKFIPLKYCPLTIELALVSNKLDAIVDPAAVEFVSSGDTSDDWEVSDVQLKGDIVTLDD